MHQPHAEATTTELRHLTFGQLPVNQVFSRHVNLLPSLLPYPYIIPIITVLEFFWSLPTLPFAFFSQVKDSLLPLLFHKASTSLYQQAMAPRHSPDLPLSERLMALAKTQQCKNLSKPLLF